MKKLILVITLIATLSVFSCQISPDPIGFSGNVSVTYKQFTSKKIYAGNQFAISTTSLLNGNALIAYIEDITRKCYFVIVDSNGNVVKADTLASEQGNLNTLSTTTLTNGNVLIVAVNNNKGHYVIVDQNGDIIKEVNDFNGASSLNNFQINTTSLANNKALINYIHPDPSPYKNMFIIIDSSGNIIKQETQITSSPTNPYFSSVVNLASNNILMIGNDLKCYFYDSSGSKIDLPNTNVPETQLNFPKCTIAGNNIICSYYTGGATGPGKIIVFDSNGNKIHISSTSIATFQTHSVTTLPNGNVLLAYSDDSAEGWYIIYDSNGNELSTATRINESSRQKPLAATTLANGKVLFAYRVDTDQTGYLTIIE